MGTQSGSSDWIEMRVPQAVLSILLVPLSQCVPVPKPQNGGTSSMSAQTAGLVSLNAMTLVPLLLAGAAFAKGYLVGNIAQRKSRSYGGYGGYGGYHRVGYSSHYQPSYSDYHHRRVDVDTQYPEDEYQTTSESTQPSPHSTAASSVCRSVLSILTKLSGRPISRPVSRPIQNIHRAVLRTVSEAVSCSIHRTISYKVAGLLL